MRTRHLFWLTLLLVVVVGYAEAQEPRAFVDVAFEDAFVVTLPEDWPVWVRGDFANFDDADTAAITLFGTVYTDVELPRPFINVDMKLLSTPPASFDDGVIRYAVEMLPLADFTRAMGVTPNAVTADILAEALGGTVTLNQRVNGRLVTFSDITLGTTTIRMATAVFPAQDRLAVVSLTAPEAFFEAEPALTSLVLSSLRLADDPLSGAAVLAQTGEPVPESWALTSEVIYVEACELTAPRDVNLREGPGLGFRVVGFLSGGATALATGQATGTDGVLWFQTESGAWVRSDVVLDGPECLELPVVER